MCSTLQHLLNDCGLIEKILAVIREEISEEGGEGDGEGSSLRVSGSRRPVVGHVITIAQVGTQAAASIHLW